MARVLTMYIVGWTMSRGQYGNFSTVTVLPSPQGLVSKPLKVVFMPLNTCILSKPLKAYKSIKQPCGRSGPWPEIPIRTSSGGLAVGLAVGWPKPVVWALSGSADGSV
jgi:hypothetical protein